ncbi:helix-turn-helix domain-containing protein [Acidomonas methanolica]|uniref:Transcriptional regulator XRE n=1 Tax=Acidomonas methanolica NBRC 104435 TaxID=1231351 RepID=A0A023D983_ACIMT|nr:helix-turn-helix transcriptional regulator [Acidomonas methanolica]MBU2655562.1 helix-turn-helix transcriptional regulator [Acidomonas methanolica]TCS20362.1 helix-turn-helix protein [Acidomonas methanolica]GAJ30712.1 transcriptional regulator XRE [Acidomonas methanolica NBRC 104435]GBQ49680.1 hypothetical protein AA0498_1043 [Acidomonas methanolica]GEL00591.1 hypothetical protein AME01nite_30890 [Acidomonas methanolica NBRC 104435]
MNVTPDQIRAARALLHLPQDELARRAHVSVVTIRRLESEVGARQVTPIVLDGVCRALEQAGAEFIPHGVRRKNAPRAQAERLFADLRAISLRSAERLKDHDILTNHDLYDENGLPA